jgi:multiple sugar transport system permease protein
VVEEGLIAPGADRAITAVRRVDNALTFISSTAQKPITLGVATDLVRGDIFFWGEIMAGALIASVPVAIAYNLFLDRFISGITGGAVK